MCFIEKETHNFILKFGGSFPIERNSAWGRMKSEEKPFFCKIYVIFWQKMVHVVIDRYFSWFVKGFEIFLSPKLSLIVPLRLN